jgi:hypothetical protein
MTQTKNRRNATQATKLVKNGSLQFRCVAEMPGSELGEPSGGAGSCRLRPFFCAPGCPPAVMPFNGVPERPLTNVPQCPLTNVPACPRLEGFQRPRFLVCEGHQGALAPLRSRLPLLSFSAASDGNAGKRRTRKNKVAGGALPSPASAKIRVP